MLSDETKRARIGRITSSIVAAVVKGGKHPYMGPLTAQRRILGEDTAQDENKAIERGNYCESGVLDFAADRLGLAWEPAPLVLHENGWSADSTDALLKDGNRLVLAEGKTVSGRLANQWGPEGTDDIPRHVIVQSCWHLYHWPQAEECVVPVLIGGWDFEFRLYRVPRRNDLIDWIVEQAHAWHQRHIVQRLPVDPDARDEGVVRQMFPRAEVDLVPMTDEMRQLAQRKVALREERKRIEEQEAECNARLCARLGDGAAAACDDTTITYRNRITNRTNWKDVATDAGATAELIARHTNVVTTRALTVACKSAPKEQHNAA